MRYKQLPLEKYRTVLKNIRQLYKAMSTGSEYPEHQEYLHDLEALEQTIQDLPEQEAIDVIVGAAVYIKEQIKYGYWVRSPEQNDKLYELLDNEFGLAQMEDAQKLSYVNFYHAFLEKNPLQHELTKKVNTVVFNIFKRKHRKVDEYKKALPTLEGLHGIIEDAFDKYEAKLVEQKSKRTTRYPLLRLMSFTNFCCKGLEAAMKTADILTKDQLRSDDRQMRMGVLTYVLTSIHRDCKWVCNPNGNWIPGSKGSDLYKIICADVKINKISDIPEGMISEAISGLQIYLSRVAMNPTHLERMAIDWLNSIRLHRKEHKSMVNKVVPDQLSYVDFTQELKGHLPTLKKYSEQPRRESWTSWGVRKSVTSLAKFSIASGLG